MAKEVNIFWNRSKNSKFGFSWYEIWGEARKILIISNDTSRLLKLFAKFFLCSTLSLVCFLGHPSESQSSISLGITYEERTRWRGPEETGVSHLRCHWSWQCCSSFPAWRSACKGWAGAPTSWPSKKQSFEISDIYGTYIIYSLSAAFTFPWNKRLRGT